MVSDVNKWSKKLQNGPNISNYIQTVTHDLKRSQMFLNGPKCLQILLNSFDCHEWFQVVSNGPK